MNHNRKTWAVKMPEADRQKKAKRWIAAIIAHSIGYQGNEQWCRRWGCRRNPRSFDLSKNRAKSLKIWAKTMKMFAKYLKIWTNYLKIRQKWRPMCRITWISFLGSFQKICAKGGNIRTKSCSKTFGKIWAKIFRTPKNLPAPTSMATNASIEQ